LAREATETNINGWKQVLDEMYMHWWFTCSS